MKNTFGEEVTLTLFGESHGEMIGAVLDGMAPGTPVDPEYIKKRLTLRSARSDISTSRSEKDEFRIVSGVKNNTCEGTPVCILIPNDDTRSADYERTTGLARPGHADYTARCKYHGYEDAIGGGHFSGRITAALTAAGAICCKALEEKGIYIGTHISRVADICDSDFSADIESEAKALSVKPFPVLDDKKAKKMRAKILEAKAASDSVGGVLETAVTGIPAGVGEPWFGSVESKLSAALFAVPAVKGVEFGLGFAFADKRGSEANDQLRSEKGKITHETNNNGGVIGGITNGMPVVFRCAVKPTPSVALAQNTVDLETGENEVIEIKGRHDPAIFHRAAFVVNAVTGLVVYDMLAQRYGVDFLAPGAESENKTRGPIYGCIGRRLSHSYSKEIHALAADYRYELYPIEPELIRDFVRQSSLGGINVTIPYKKEVMKYLDVIDPQALSVGSVNTVVNHNGKLYGYNTDVYGMKCLLAKNGISLTKKKVLILGTGGTSLTAMTAAKELGAAQIIRVSRSGKDGAVTYVQAVAEHADAQVILNTTPVGMYPDTVGLAPVDLGSFPALTGVADVIYNPLRSALVLDAESRGIPTCGGLYMLVFQAIRASELFTGRKISEEKGKDIYRRIYSAKCNIVLTGMPASGKSTIGKALAEKLGREFIDTDEEIEKAENATIAEIFAAHGEKYFRCVEEQVILSLRNKTGAVIATGGGSVLRKVSVNALKANGKLFFIDRELKELLPTKSRPLASTVSDIEKRYNERIDIYNDTADVVIKPQKTPELTADIILRSFS